MKAVFANPFQCAGSWYKGNLHIHTNKSDGWLSSEKIIRAYRKKGYDFIAITDHNIVRDYKSKFKNFIVVRGAEVSFVGKSEAGVYFDFVAVGFDKKFKIPKRHCHDIMSKIGPQEMIDTILVHGGIVFIAHPYFYSISSAEIMRLKGYHGIEIYNTSVDRASGKGYSSVHWDDLLARGAKITGIASDDAHGHYSDTRPIDLCGAWILVKASEFSKEAISKSIREGLFYSSNGPLIKNIILTSKAISAVTSKVHSISFISQGVEGKKYTALKDSLTTISHRLKGPEKYLRIECEDKKGRKAWSNPIYFENE